MSALSPADSPKTTEPKTPESKFQWTTLVPWFFLIALIVFVVIKKQSSATTNSELNPPTRVEPEYPALQKEYSSLLIFYLKKSATPDPLGEMMAAQLTSALSEVPGLIPNRRSPEFFRMLNRLTDHQKLKPALTQVRKFIEFENVLYLTLSANNDLFTFSGELHSRDGKVTLLEATGKNNPVELILSLGNEVTKFFGLGAISWNLPKILEEDSARQFYGLSQHYWSLRNVSKAYQEAEKLLKTYPEEPFALLTMAEIELAQKRKKLALERVEKVLQKNPQEQQALLIAGKIYYEESMRKGIEKQAREEYWKKAEEALLQALKRNPNLWEAYEKMGKLLYAQKWEELAFQANYRALQIHPSIDLAWYCSEYLAFSERIQEAITCYRKLIEKIPESSEAYLRLGYFLARLDVFEEAHQQMEKALQMGSAPERVSHYQSFVYFFENETEKSINALKKALQQNPRYNAPNLTLGYIYKNFSNDPENAYQYLKAYKEGGGKEANLEPWLQELTTQIQEKKSEISQDKK
ncbi:MAG: tetratricopeptide repeat protein [Planctomycetota bacterium]